MRIILTLAFLLAFTGSAFAEGSKITVVNPDGTKTSIDIGPSPAESAVDTEHITITPPRKVDADTASLAKPAKDAAVKSGIKPAKKPAPEKQVAKKASVKKDAAPKKKKTASKTQKTAKRKNAVKNPAPKATAPEAPRATAAQSAPHLGPNMTSDDAIRIALDVAPPARSVHAIPVNYKGLHAYQVVFATEDGDRSVFVDRETGRTFK